MHDSAARIGFGVGVGVGSVDIITACIVMVSGVEVGTMAGVRAGVDVGGSSSNGVGIKVGGVEGITGVRVQEGMVGVIVLDRIGIGESG